MPQQAEYLVHYKTADGQLASIWGTETDHQKITRELNSPGPSASKTLVTIIIRYQEELKAIEKAVTELHLQTSVQEKLRLLEEEKEQEEENELAKVKEKAQIEIIKYKGIITQLLEHKAQQLSQLVQKIQQLSKAMHEDTASSLSEFLFNIIKPGKKGSNIKAVQSLINSAQELFSSSKEIQAISNFIEESIGKLELYKNNRALPSPRIVNKMTPKEQELFNKAVEKNREKGKQNKQPITEQGKFDLETYTRLLNISIGIKDAFAKLGDLFQEDIEKFKRENPKLSPKDEKCAILERKEAVFNEYRELKDALIKDLTNFQNKVTENAFATLEASMDAVTTFSRKFSSKDNLPEEKTEHLANPSHR